MKEKTDGTCQTCHEKPGQLVIDPYLEDVENQTVPVILCDDCTQEAIDDI